MVIKDHIALLRYISRNTNIKAALYVLLVVLLAMGVEIIIWLMAWHENTDLHRDVKHRINQSHNQVKLSKLGSHLENVLPLVESIESKYKMESSQSDIMKHIGNLAQRHKIRVLSQSYTRSEQDANSESAEVIQLNVSGRYTDIRRMINKIPTMPVWIEVTEIQIERLVGKNSMVGVQIRLAVLRKPAQ